MPPIDEKLTEDNEASVNYLVSSLHSLMTHFNVKEDIYAMGKHSEYVADKLESLPAAVDRRKVICTYFWKTMTGCEIRKESGFFLKNGDFS